MKTYSRNYKVHVNTVKVPKQCVHSCRLCFNIVLNSVPFDDITKDKIKYCVGLEVAKCDRLPSNLCKRCFKKLENFYAFKKMCISNDVKSQELQLHRNVYRERDCAPTKNLDYVHTTYKEDERISLLENTVETKSFLLEEGSIHPDAPDEVIFQLKKDTLADILHTQNICETNLKETLTSVNEEVNIPESCRPVLRCRDSLTRAYPCRKCKHCFTRVDRLIWHEKQVHKIQRLYCNHCSKSFVSKGLFERHMRTHTGCKPFRCNICSKTFTQKESMIRHFGRLHCEKKYECEKCPKMFTSREGLKSHYFTYHTERINEHVNRYKCKFCTKSFCHSSGLSRHLLSHTGVISTCKICQKGFSDASCLRRHLLVIHHRVGVAVGIVQPKTASINN